MLLRITIVFVALLTAMTISSGRAKTLYVAGNGSGNCASASSPCASIGEALKNANPGDKIACLSSPVPAPLNITRSVTIDCSGVRSYIGESSLVLPDETHVAIIINIPVSPADPFRTVRLRGLTIDGMNNNGTRFQDRGIDIQAATAIFIEDSVIANVNKQGIFDHRTGGQTKLFLTDTVISGAGGAGIAAVSAAVATTTLDNVTSENNAYGIAVGAGNNVSINRSRFSENSAAGVEADSGAQVVLNGSSITHNGMGIQSASSIRLSNNDIAFNKTAISGASTTLGGNRFSGNASLGTAPTAVRGATDLGQ